MDKILITGSDGVIGSALRGKFEDNGTEIIPFDIKRGLDICNKEQLLAAVADGIGGVIHCAAVARVCECENNAALCRKTNIDGTRNIVECLQTSANKPWLLFLSSKEVYGQASALPVTEDFPYNPINEYARSKVEGEKIVGGYPNSGVIRLTNVYGSVNDHDNRLIPALTKAALSGRPLILNGADNTLDFVHISDAVNGIFAYCRNRLRTTIHLASGRSLTIRRLAQEIARQTNSESRIMEMPARKNEISCFYGDPRKAKEVLGWQTKISLEDGIGMLIKEEQI